MKNGDRVEIISGASKGRQGKLISGFTQNKYDISGCCALIKKSRVLLDGEEKLRVYNRYSLKQAKGGVSSD